MNMRKIYLALMAAAMCPAAAYADSPLSLPLADSFADASLASFWTQEKLQGVYAWEAVAKAEDTPAPDAQDADGGYLYYHAYRATKGSSARLATGPVAAASATAPVIQFYLYNHTTGNDLVKAQVSLDGGEWTDVPGASFPIKGDAAGWTQVLVPLADAVAGATDSFRVALTAESAYGFNICVDNVRLFNMAGKDLEVSVDPAASLVAGAPNKLAITVANNGAAPVAAADYALYVTCGATGIDVPAGSLAAGDIPALGAVTIEMPVEINALHATDNDAIPFTATVEMAGDEVVANNSSTALVPTGFSANPAVPMAAIEDIDGAKVLSWSHAVDPDYAPMAMEENFEEYDEGALGPWNGWTAIDLDRRDGGQAYNAKGSALNVGVIQQGSSWRSILKGFEGEKMLCVTVPSAVQQDDWLVSPLLTAAPSSTFTLSFKIAYKQFSQNYGDNLFDILYTTDDGEVNVANPAAMFNCLFEARRAGQTQDVKNDETFYDVVVEGIPAAARRVAVNFKSKLTTYNPNAMWLDCLKLTEVNPVALGGYNVYELGAGRLNDEIIPAAVSSYTVAEAGAAGAIDPRSFFVTAVYADGEAAPSETVTLQGAQVGLREVDSADADTAPAEYFNLQGIRVAAPAPGQPVIERRGSAARLIAR